MGPRAANHYAFVGGNFLAIPHFFTPEEVDNIMFAFRMWYRPLEEDDPLGWQTGEFMRHQDPRSIEETMVNFTRNADFHILPHHVLIPDGMPHGASFAFRVWTGEHQPAGILEEAQQVWNETLERANALFAR